MRASYLIAITILSIIILHLSVFSRHRALVNYVEQDNFFRKSTPPAGGIPEIEKFDRKIKSQYPEIFHATPRKHHAAPFFQTPTPNRINIDYQFYNNRIPSLYRDKLSSYFDDVWKYSHMYLLKRFFVVNKTQPFRIPTHGSCSRLFQAIPKEHFSTPITKDVMIYLEFYYDEVSNKGASSGSCLRDSSTGRPVAGVVRLNMANILELSLDSQRTMLIHEYMHILGFGPDHWSYFRDSNGNIRGNVVDLTFLRNRVRTIIKSPRLLEEARSHFNCSKIKGIDLENDGGSGTRLRHWEMITLPNEAMIGIDAYGQKFSRMTFAVFEDSGWYEINWRVIDREDNYTWGKNKGCEFFDKLCEYNNLNNATDRHFCKRGERKCLHDFSMYAECGTEFDLADTSCGFLNPIPITDCKNTLNRERNSQTMNVFSDKSKCFESSIIKKRSYSSFDNWRCYEYECSPEGGLRVKIGAKSYSCPGSEKITIDDESAVGWINCPSSEEVLTYFCQK